MKTKYACVRTGLYITSQLDINSLVVSIEEPTLPTKTHDTKYVIS